LDISANRFTALSPAFVLDIGPTLCELHMAHNAISDLPIGIMGALQHLNVLNLSHNQLRALPEDMMCLPSLKCLDVSHNRLVKLPATTSNLVNLHTLIVNNNHLTTFPGAIGRLQSNLTQLVAHDNALETLPHSFQFLTALEAVTIEQVEISAADESITPLPHSSVGIIGSFSSAMHGTAAAASAITASTTCSTDAPGEPIKLEKLLKLLRMSPHPAIMRAIATLSSQPEYQEILVDEAAHFLAYIANSATPDGAAAAARTLRILTEVAFFRPRLFNQGATDVLLAKVKEEQFNSIVAANCLDALAWFCLNGLLLNGSAR
jgi:hypothetical protein